MRLLSLLLVFAFATPAFAEDIIKNQPLSAQDMEKLLPGKTIKGEYRFLRQRTKTFNFRETHYADGITAYEEGALKVAGRWYTLGERKICYKYPDEPDMGISCFWVYKSNDGSGDCYYGYGVQSMTPKGPRRYADWSARWIVEGTGGSCREPVS
jgi:hypothetical protein